MVVEEKQVIRDANQSPVPEAVNKNSKNTTERVKKKQ